MSIQTAPTINKGWLRTDTFLAEYILDGKFTGIKLTKDDEIYTLWIKGSVYLRTMDKKRLNDGLQRLIASLNGISNQKKATTFKGKSID